MLAWIADDYLESFYSLSYVWIDRPLMPCSDVTTQKPGRDFDWLIVETFAWLCIIMRNFIGIVVWYSADGMPGMLEWSSKI